MKFSVSELEVDKRLSEYKIAGKDGLWLTDLARVNIFVGPNNSGKSRLLRNLSTLIKSPTHFRPKQISVKKIAIIIAELKQYVNEIINEYSGVHPFAQSQEKIEVVEAITQIQDIDYFTFAEPPFLQNVIQQLQKLQNVTVRNNSQYSHNGRVYSLRDFVSAISGKARDIEERLKYEEELPTTSIKTIYIPSLRGIRTLFNEIDVYSERTKKDYFTEYKPDEIFTGYTLYREIRSLLLGDLSQRELVRSFEDFLSRTFFRGEKVALIPREIDDKDDLFIKIGTEDEFPVQQLGDGIQQIIIITFPLFRDKDKDLIVFIEEPELYLHPGMQRILLNVLLGSESFRGHQFFLTTHSNHFLDLTLDQENISIFSFSKLSGGENQKFVIENVEGPSTSVLSSIGVRNSSVFLTNCTIWVEGITDRYYLRHYLDLYQQSQKIPQQDKLQEDIHFSFVEYAGNNISHWSFLDKEEKPINVDRLCGKLMLITDGDGDKKLERKEKLTEYLGSRYICLKSREIENLISKKVLVEVLKEYEKDDNLDYNEFSESNYRTKYLGKFIEENILKTKKREGSYQLESGTTSNKQDFCDKAIKHQKHYDDLSKEAKALTEVIFNFIKENNED